MCIHSPASVTTYIKTCWSITLPRRKDITTGLEAHYSTLRKTIRKWKTVANLSILRSDYALLTKTGKQTDKKTSQMLQSSFNAYSLLKFVTVQLEND